MHIFVYEQSTSTDGFYKLRDTIYEELKVGISNFQYNKMRALLLNSSVDFVASSKFPLVQAGDILANRIWNSFRLKQPKFRAFMHHKYLHMFAGKTLSTKEISDR